MLLMLLHLYLQGPLSSSKRDCCVLEVVCAAAGDDCLLYCLLCTSYCTTVASFLSPGVPTDHVRAQALPLVSVFFLLSI